MRKKFSAGDRVRVAQDARIVGQPDPHNPYWFEVEYAHDGRREVVNLGRIEWHADEPRVALDHDGSLQIVSTRLSPRGALELLAYLQSYAGHFETLAQGDNPRACTQEDESEVSHDP